jgi:hypothetical protein
MLQQVSDPLTIPRIGLAPRHRLDVLGIDEQQGEVGFQQGEVGFQ